MWHEDAATHENNDIPKKWSLFGDAFAFGDSRDEADGVLAADFGLGGTTPLPASGISVRCLFTATEFSALLSVAVRLRECFSQQANSANAGIFLT